MSNARPLHPPVAEFRNPGNTIMNQKRDRFEKVFADRRRFYLEHCEEMYFATFDKPDLLGFDFPFRDRVLFNRRGLPSLLYAFLAPFIHRRSLAQCRAFFAVQVPASLYPWYCALFFRRARVCVYWNYDWIEMANNIGKPLFYRLFVHAWVWLTLRGVRYFVVTNGEDARRILGAKPSARVLVQPTPISLSLFRPLGLERVPGRLVFVGRLTFQKNLEALIDAVATLPGTELQIVGEGEMRETLEVHARAKNAPVSFLGRQTQEQIVELLNRASLFVLPSHFEGVSNALVEAMACGLPAVTSDIYTNREIIRHGENGYLCGRSPGEIAAAIRHALDHPDETARCASTALAMVRENYALETYFARVTDFVFAP